MLISKRGLTLLDITLILLFMAAGEEVSFLLNIQSNKTGIKSSVSKWWMLVKLVKSCTVVKKFMFFDPPLYIF